MQSKNTLNKVWLRTVDSDEKIVKEQIYEWRGEGITPFLDTLREVLEGLDEPTPVVLKSHFLDLKQFNVVRFTSRDFIETVYFEKMILELVK